MRIAAMGVLMAGLVSGAGMAAAQSVAITAEQVVLTRQGGMAMVGSLASLMKAGVTAEADPKLYQEPAAALAKWGTAYPALFPDGTQNVGNTKAKAEIWSDRAGFEKANAAFVAASITLAEAAKSNDKAAFATAFAEEGKTCVACHRNYRER